MDREKELFVQAFWVKCRETIRPEIDAVIGELRTAGNDAAISTQEYSSIPDSLPAEVGPSLTLSLRPKGPSDGVVQPAIQFHGDVAHETVEVHTSTGERHSYSLSELDAPEVRNEIDDWLGRVITPSHA